MNQKIYQVDAFANALFGGNPAAVCPLDQWLADDLMQKIAMENNLAETAFYVKEEGRYNIRWFTPSVEVDLCGHATLASAFVLFKHENYEGSTVEFFSARSGSLSVSKEGEWFTLNFPVDEIHEIGIPIDVSASFNLHPKIVYKGKTDYMLVFETEEEIKTIIPMLDKIASLNARGVIITAKGEKTDFVSRFFAPQSGVNEDPVTGSAHTTLIPYWAGVLGKNEMTAIQLSPRSGFIKCRYMKERVEISGEGKLYMKGEIYI